MNKRPRNYGWANTAYHQIRKPIWHNRSVGIAERKIKEHNVITITAKDKDGNKLYPDEYYVSGEQLMKGQIMETKGVKLRVVEIKDLEKIINI